MRQPRDYKLTQQDVNNFELMAYNYRGRNGIILTARGPIYPKPRTLRTIAARMIAMADWMEDKKGTD